MDFYKRLIKILEDSLNVDYIDVDLFIDRSRFPSVCSVEHWELHRKLYVNCFKQENENQNHQN